MNVSPENCPRDIPRVILLDAVGTLFGVRGSVGEIYADIARQFEVNVSPKTLNAAFLQAFRAASPMAFPGIPSSEVAQYEYQWWEAIAQQSFKKAGVLEQFSNFSEFFAALYAYFATAAAWSVYPDVRPTLTHWHTQSIELGILSNFDTRLYAVLPALGLADFFSSITISTEVGAAKPDARIFRAALKKHNCSADRAWHIGDSLKEDYQGAKAIGLRAIWLKRGE